MSRKFNVIDRTYPKDIDTSAVDGKGHLSLEGERKVIYKNILGKEPIQQHTRVRESLPYMGIARRALEGQSREEISKVVDATMIEHRKKKAEGYISTLEGYIKPKKDD